MGTQRVKVRASHTLRVTVCGAGLFIRTSDSRPNGCNRRTVQPCPDWRGHGFLRLLLLLLHFLHARRGPTRPRADWPTGQRKDVHTIHEHPPPWCSYLSIESGEGWATHHLVWSFPFTIRVTYMCLSTVVGVSSASDMAHPQIYEISNALNPRWYTRRSKRTASSVELRSLGSYADFSYPAILAAIPPHYTGNELATTITHVAMLSQ